MSRTEFGPASRPLSPWRCHSSRRIGGVLPFVEVAIAAGLIASVRGG